MGTDNTDESNTVEADLEKGGATFTWARWIPKIVFFAFYIRAHP
jgi:hypothetical protein